MSDAPDKDSKTEEATDKKKRDSIQKGQVPFSKEATMFASLLAMLVVAALMLAERVGPLALGLGSLLSNPGAWPLESGVDATRLFRALGLEAMAFMAPMVLVLATFAIAGSLLQNPPQLVLHRIKPEFSKLSPSKGAKRLFGAQGQSEFLKSLFKFGTVALVAIVLLGSESNVVMNAMFDDPAAVPELILTIAVRLLSAVSVATIVLVAADLVWSRFHWERELRMTKQEVKDEAKQAEGDPLLKARRLSLARDRSRRRMIANVPTATLVVANPTHFAVAMRYRREDGGAPVVVAKGTDLVALKIREVAEESGVPVIEDKPLARSLYDCAELDKMIPPEFYRAVAEILCFLNARDVNGATSR